MMIDLDELMRLREAATPGPWQVKIGDITSEDWILWMYAEEKK